MLVLDDARMEVIQSPRNLIVMGGPGSGKTTVALLKAEELIGRKVLKEHQQVLFLSFARATVARVAEQAGKLLPKLERGRLEVNTYHGFTWNLLRSHGYLLRTGRPLSLLPPPEAAARLSTLGEDQIAQEKIRLLEEEGLLHFDLFASNAALLLESSQALRRIYGGSYPLIILDEFQDTNEDEWRFIRALTQHSQVMALADPEQRIYEFRGANALRIQEFEQAYQPAAFTFGMQNHRSSGTDIVQFGNDVLTGENRGKRYANVTVKPYIPRRGQLHLDFKYAVLAALTRLKQSGNDWSLTILVPSKSFMVEVSAYLSSTADRLPSITHDVAFDQEAAALSATAIAALLEGGSTTSEVTERLIRNLCAHLRGRKGEKPPTKPHLELVEALEEMQRGQPLRRVPHKRVLAAAEALAAQRLELQLTGDPQVDWIAVRQLLDSSTDKVFTQIGSDGRYVRLLGKGSLLRSRLNEIWRSAEGYPGAEGLVRDALLQDHFQAATKDWKGIHLMTMHKSKGKEFTEVILYEGLMKGRFVQTDANADRERQARLAMRVAVTRAMKRATILTPQGRNRSPLL
ncbi:UvrD-helicase domain-containing protein [Pseudomonas sp. UM16]|uniref:UvrD-helicase domain-containing protein n=1 Tax=Pseudomonas sp. UM16 TaxID=3158962 RepID=UPI0039901AC4